MTTIAWDGKTLAADSQSTTGSFLCSTKEEKLHKPGCKDVWRINGEEILCFGASGDCGSEQAIIDALISGFTYKTELPDILAFAAIAAVSHQRCFLIFKDSGKKTASISLHKEKFAVGSGSDIARTAMHLGNDSVRAVQIASELDVYTGGEIKSIVVTQVRNENY